MFKIKYRITDSIKELNNLSDQEIENGGAIEGYFELTVNDKTYEYINEGLLQEGERGDQLITNWFEQLLAVLIELKKGHTYVALNDIESYNTWIEFKKLKNGMISISVIKAEKKNGVGGTVNEPLENVVYSDWSNKLVSYDEIFHEVINKTNEYLCEVNTINEKLANGETLTNLKNRMLNLKSMVKI